MEKEKFYSRQDVLEKARLENYYQAITVRETPRKGFDPIAFVTSVAGKADDVLLQLAYQIDSSPRNVRKGFVATFPEGGINNAKFSHFNPAHYVVILRDPMKTYAERRKMEIEEVQNILLENEDSMILKKKEAVKKEISLVKNLQNTNLDAAVRLSTKQKAGLSIIYSYIEDFEGLNDRQAEFINQIISQVASLTLPKSKTA